MPIVTEYLSATEASTHSTHGFSLVKWSTNVACPITSYLSHVMTDGLSLVKLPRSNESKEISLESRFILSVQLGQGFLLPGRSVGVQLSDVTRAIATIPPQRMQRILPRLSFVSEKLHLFPGKRSCPYELPILS